MIKKKIIIGTAIYQKDYVISNLRRYTSKNLNNVFSECYKHGIKNFDLASSYGNSEKNFGKIFYKKNITIDTKVSKITTKRNAQYRLFKSFFKSLKKLNKKRVDTLYVHDFKNFLKFKNEYKFFFKSLKKSKKINNIGFSLYEKNELHQLLRICKPDVVQVPLNLFNQSFNTPEVFNLKKKFNFKIYARSIFLQGILLASIDDIPNKFRKVFQKYEKFLLYKKMNKLDACLNFVFKTFFDKFIIGIQNEKQLKMILDKLKIRYNTKINFKKLHVKSKLLNDPRRW